MAHQIGELSILAALDGSQVRLSRDGKVVATLAPLVHDNSKLPRLQLQNSAWPLVYQAGGITVRLDSVDEDLRVEIESERPVEGPVLRVFGNLEQGLLAGVEYLGKGEHSSSKLDIETAEHLRVRPPPMHLTMPLAAFVNRSSFRGDDVGRSLAATDIRIARFSGRRSRTSCFAPGKTNRCHGADRRGVAAKWSFGRFNRVGRQDSGLARSSRSSAFI